MTDDHSPAQLDREVMAMLLSTNVQLVAEVLGADENAPGQVMRAIAATRSLNGIVEDTLRSLVNQARAAGHTWAEVGDVLHVSRQAAFQRFGGSHIAPADGTIALPVEDAVDHALPVLQAFIDGRFDDARAVFDERMLAACSTELMADVRDRVRIYGGEVEMLGTPVVSVDGGYTVVTIPVAMEHAEGYSRIVLDADRKVAGFFVRPAETVS